MLSPASTTTNNPAAGIDHVSFPDIIDRILLHCDREAVFMLRRPENSNKLMYDLINKRLFRHVAIIRVHENVHYKPKVETFQIVDVDGRRRLPIPPFKCYDEDLAKRNKDFNLTTRWDLKSMNMLEDRRDDFLRLVRMVDTNSAFPRCVNIRFPRLDAARIFHNSTHKTEFTLAENHELHRSRMVIRFLDASPFQAHSGPFDTASHNVGHLDIILSHHFRSFDALDSLPRFLKAACGGGTVHNVRLVGVLKYIRPFYARINFGLHKMVKSYTVEDFVTRTIWSKEEPARLAAGRAALFEAIDAYQVAQRSTRDAPVVIDHTGFPEIIDTILDACDHDGLLHFRAASRAYYDRINRRLFNHVAIVLKHENYNVYPEVRTFHLVDLEGRKLPIPPFKAYGMGFPGHIKTRWATEQLKMLLDDRAAVLPLIRTLDIQSTLPPCIRIGLPPLRAVRIFHNGISEAVQDDIRTNPWNNASYHPPANTVVMFGACIPTAAPNTGHLRPLKPYKIIIRFLDAVIDVIVGLAPRDALLSLRPVCHWLKTEVNKQLFYHVTIKAGKETINDQDGVKVQTYFFTDTDGKRLPLSAFQLITPTTGRRRRSVFHWSPDEYMRPKKRAQAMHNIRVVDYPMELARRRDLTFGGLTTARVFFDDTTPYSKLTGIWVQGTDTIVITGHHILRSPPELYNRGPAPSRTRPTCTAVLNVTPRSPHYCSGHAEAYSKDWGNFNLVVILSPCTFVTNGAFASMCFARQFVDFVDAVRKSVNQASITLVGVQEFLQATLHSVGGSSKRKLELGRLLGAEAWEECSEEHKARIELMTPELARLGVAIDQHDVVCKTLLEYKGELTTEQANLQLSGNISPSA
ncbi:uncharacterized protein LOC62_03G003897 [Vanrija pseudolonga]|uniref:Uncharacterized protein n=1 Tax=Vanrija pseudolonga TaxID=143232 RepID=A0AAF0YB39_9TREE|nr:hypothetical protein LOC62_03G003897 [Vanrija pseudolonga]